MSAGEFKWTILGGVITTIMGMGIQYARDRNAFANSRQAMLENLKHSLEEDILQINATAQAYRDRNLNFTVVTPTSLMIECFITSSFCKPSTDKSLISGLLSLNLDYKALQITSEQIKSLQATTSTSPQIIGLKIQNKFASIEREAPRITDKIRLAIDEVVRIKNKIIIAYNL